MAVALPYALSTPFVAVVFEAEVSEMLNWLFQMTKKGGGNAIPVAGFPQREPPARTRAAAWLCLGA